MIEYRSENYNYNYNPETGFFAKWGKTYDDDPKYSPIGPEILDIEISTICHGINNIPCAHCYKSNNSNGKNMTISTFKKLFKKLPNNVGQIAFGIGDLHSNPDMYSIFKHCRENKVIPNVTINGWDLQDHDVELLFKYCGAVSVSRYEPADVCYNAIKKLSDIGLKQVNMHCLLSKETLPTCYQVMNDYYKDERLSNMNAIVFLLLKPKGNRNNYHSVNYDEYEHLVNYALKYNIKIGFDSCSAPFFLQAVKSSKNFKDYSMMCESCESSLFSGYINVDAKWFHCSFIEGLKDWFGIDILSANDFIKDIWYAKETKKLRSLLMAQNNDIHPSARYCPVYKDLIKI